MIYSLVMKTTNESVRELLLESMDAGCWMDIELIQKYFKWITGNELDITDIRSHLEALNLAHEAGCEIEIDDPGPSSVCAMRYRRPIAVGMGATYSIGSDRYACTVIKVSKSCHKITTRDDKATRTDSNGISEDQRYSYERDPNGEVREFYRNSSGSYGNRTQGGRLGLGRRSTYLDPSF